MRRILWITGLAAALLVLLVLLIPAVVDADKYKPQIEQQLAAASHKKVRLGHASFSLVPPVTVRVSDVRIDDPAYPDGPSLLEAPSMELRIDPWAYFQGNTVISELRLQKPRITVRRLPASHGSLEKQPESGTRTAAAVKVQGVFLEDLSLKVLDEDSSDGSAIFSLDNVDLAIPDFDPSQIENPFAVKATMNFAGASLATAGLPEPVRFDAGAGQAGNNQFQITGLRATVQGTSVEGQASAAPLDHPEINFQLHFKEVDLGKLRSWGKLPGASGTAGAAARAGAAPSRTLMPKVKLGGTITSDRTLLGDKVVENTTSRIRMENNQLDLEEFKGRFYGGTLETSGKVTLAADRPEYRLRSAMRGVNLGQLLIEAGKPERLTGRLDLDAEVSGSGLPRGKDDLAGLRGSGRFSITDGSLKTFNLLEKLKILSVIPFLKVVEGPITSFAALKSDFRLNGRKIETDRMQLNTGSLNLLLTGYCTLDEELNYIARIEEEGGDKPNSLVSSILGMVARNANVEFQILGTLSKPDVTAYRR